MNKIFISGIDTGVGKSYATAFFGRWLLMNGRSATTQKLVQTGNEGYSEDLDLHCRIMGRSPIRGEELSDHCPAIFKFASSPHLAAEKENTQIDFDKLKSAAAALGSKYDVVLIEGAGGLCVPLTRDVLTIDYVEQMGYPTILVSSGQLGSINHTILSLEALKSRGMFCGGIIYNLLKNTNREIENDTRDFFRHRLKKCGFPCVVVDLPYFELEGYWPEVDFAPLAESLQI